MPHGLDQTIEWWKGTLKLRRRGALPASQLPKVIDAWEKPKHEEFAPRTAWSLFNAFTEIQYLLADAILDRLVHAAYRIKLKGESMRKQKTPLTAKAQEK